MADYGSFSSNAASVFLGSSAPTVAPLSSADPAADLLDGLQALSNANMRYAEASSYYDGSQPEFFASMRLRIAMGATGVVFNFNFAKLPVDAVAERLEIASLTVPNDAAMDVVNDAWRDNMLDLHAPDIMKKACMFGDSYVFVWPNPDGDVDGDGIPDVDIFYNSPRTMRVIYDDEDELVKRYAIKRWVDGTTRYVFVNLYYADRIEKYMQAPTKKDQSEPPEWQRRLDLGDVAWPLENPYGQVPVFHFRNGFPYGKPEHKDAYGPQDAIHKLVINHMASVDYSAFPQRYALVQEGYDTSEAAFGDEGEFAFSLDTGATMDTGVDPKSQLTADPASVWFMKGVKSYGQFPVGDHRAFMGPFIDYIHAMAVVTTTPMQFLDPIVANVSGESLRVIEGPFVKKVRNRQLSFGATWRDVFGFVLRIQEIDPTLRVHVSWVPAATVNDIATLQGMVIKSELGVPPVQLLTELGYTPEQLEDWNISVLPSKATLAVESAVGEGAPSQDEGTSQEL